MRHVYTIRHTKSCYSVCTRMKIIFLLVQANITSKAFGVSEFSSFKRLNLLRVKSFGLLPTMFWVCVVCSQTIYFPLEVVGRILDKKAKGVVGSQRC